MGPSSAVRVGGRYGRWTVVEAVEGRGHRRFRCRCACGAERPVLATNLLRGLTRSCGCLRDELASGRAVTHGLTRRGERHPLYGVWKGVHKRCSYPGDKRWANYGGRGITVCERWSGRDGFVNFLADMGPRPDGMTLDRIDNDGNYEPTNCRWATAVEQRRNRPHRRKEA